MESLSMTLNEQTGHLWARFDPTGGAPLPDPALLLLTAAELGWHGFHFDERAIDGFIDACRKADKPVDAVVAARRDGEFAIAVDDDLMTAWLTMSPPRGGEAVSGAQIDEALRAQGIVYGIQRDRIEAALAVGHCERLGIACGTPAQEGIETRFEQLFGQQQEAVDEEDTERIRYADLSHILVVKPGDPLMRRVPPMPGTNGSNIKGHALLPRPTPDIQFRTDLKGAARDKDDPDLLVAAAGGQPVLAGHGVMVNSVVDVGDVDLGTGSISFEGTLRVGGDVKAGLRIKVSGDVIVNGTVEAAEIVAGGNVAVRGGVVGHPDTRPGAQALPENTARILCEGTVQALFTESAHIEAGNSIIIGRSARLCELIARDEVVVGKGRTGQITGGRTQATRRVATFTLGTSTGSKTQVQVGIDPYLDKQIAEKDRELKRKIDEIDRVAKLLTYFRQNPKKIEPGMLDKVEATRRHLMSAIDDITGELKTLREKLELSEDGRVEVLGNIFYGVEVRIGNQMWQAPDDMGSAAVQMQSGRIAVNRSGRRE